MSYICNDCYEKVADEIEVEDDEIEEEFAESCKSCGVDVWGDEVKYISNIFLSEEMKDSITSSIIGCWNHGCARIWDGVDKEWAMSELNATLSDAFSDAWSGLANETYKSLIDDLDVDEVECPTFICPECGQELEGWYDDIKVRSFVRTLPIIPELPSELSELTVPENHERIEFFRPDCSKYLIHLTKPNRLVEGYDNEEYESQAEDYNTPQTLFIILKTQRLNKQKGRGMYEKAVCFTEKSLTALKETLFGDEAQIRSGGGGIKWFPYGLMFEKKYLQESFDAQTVINLDQNGINDFKENQKELLYRVVKNTKSVSWLHEREWRTKNSVEFNTEEAIVIVPTYEQVNEFRKILENEGIKVKGFLPILDISSAI